MDITSIPADIWQYNIFPYSEKPDFLNLVLSNKKVYDHLQSKKRTKTYSNNHLWDIFYTKCIKEIETFMDDTFTSIKKTIDFPKNILHRQDHGSLSLPLPYFPLMGRRQ